MLNTWILPRGGSRGDLLGSNNPPFLHLMVLIVTLSVFDTQCLHASLVWLLYNLHPIVTGVFGEVGNLLNFSKGGAS